jgi:hypothetical protein
VPISYYGRTYAEGKKIGWQDGMVALWVSDPIEPSFGNRPKSCQHRLIATADSD